jgi:hypothetical protein
MRARPRSKTSSIIVGWLLVTFSCLTVIGISLAVLKSDPALGAATTTSQAAAHSAAQSSTTMSRFEETDARLAYSGSWTSASYKAASQGKEKYAWRSGNYATITFTGTSFTWISAKGPYCGIGRVTVDGGSPVLVDFYSASNLYQQAVYSTGTLSSATHTVKIEWTGKKNSKARGTLVYLDAVDVAGTLTSPTTATTVAAATTSTTAATTSTTLATTTTSAPATTTTTAATTTTTTVAPTTTTSTTAAPTTTTTAAPATTSTTVAPTTSTTVPAPVNYNVMSYGAKGDGATDDANAIQAAVNAAHSAGGGTVYLPAGTYRLYAARSLDGDLGANIELFDNVTVKGAGPSSTTVVADHDWASAFGALRRANPSVQDMTIKAGASQQDGVKFGVCTTPLVQDVVVHDIYIGIALYSCTDGVVRNCKAYNCINNGTGIWIGQGETWSELSMGGLIEDCEAWGSTFISFRVAGNASSAKRATGVTLRRCYSHNTGTQDFLFTYSGTLTLDSCTSGATGYSGIRFAGVTGATLSGSTAPFVTTNSNDPSAYAVYGGSTNILVQ